MSGVMQIEAVVAMRAQRTQTTSDVTSLFGLGFKLPLPSETFQALATVREDEDVDDQYKESFFKLPNEIQLDNAEGYDDGTDLIPWE